MPRHPGGEARALQLARAYDLEQCATDPIRFVKKHVTIEDPDGTILPFTLWPFQQLTLGTLHATRLVVVLKARRLGLSWLTLGYALWLAIFQPGSRILMLCKRQDDSREMVGRIKRVYERMTESQKSFHVVSHLRVSRDASDQFQIGTSVFRALPATPAAARQETAAFLIWDEAAFVDEAPEIMQGALPTIEGGGKAAIISTGNGLVGQGAEFARIWGRTKEPNSPWAGLFWPWSVRPDRSPEWKQRTIAELGAEERFRTEYPEVESDALQRPGALYVFTDALIQKGHATEHGGFGPVRLGVDVARQGDDFTTIYSWQNGRVRIVRRGHWSDLMVVADQVHLAAQDLGAELVVVDATGLGAGVVDRLVQLGVDAVPFVAGMRANQPHRYVNRRAEIAWEFREGLRDGLIDLDPEDLWLLQDLQSVEWSTDSIGRFVLESKDRLRAKGYPSPDHADGAFMAACGVLWGSMGGVWTPTGHKRPAITDGLMDKPM